MTWSLIVLLETLGLFFLSSLVKRKTLVLFYSLFRNQNTTIAAFSLLFYPGVVVHELSHLVAAAVLFVPVKDLILVPKIIEGKIRGGSVVIEKVDIFRRTIVGIAPLFGGIGAMWGISQFVSYELRVTSWVQILLFIYLMFSVSATMYSSQKDLEALIYTIPLLVVLVGVLYIVGFEFVSLLSLLAKMEGFFEMLSSVLVIPLIIQGILVIFLTVISGGRLWGLGRPK